MARRREPGWYSDPTTPGRWRWWDGRAWTEHSVSAYSDIGRATTTEPRPTPPGGSPRATSRPPGERPGAPGERPGKPGVGGSRVFVRRWAAVVAGAAVLVAVVVVVFRGQGPVLYWHGEPFSGADQVLGQGAAAMQVVARQDEGALSSASRCYFSLPESTSHDVSPYLRCGPVLLPWSRPGSPWLTFPLSAKPEAVGSGSSVHPVPLEVRTTPLPFSTGGLARGEVLARPDGTAAPPAAGGIHVPVVPRQPPGWGGTLVAPPGGLVPAPASALVGDWGQSYRVVSYGETGSLPARLSPRGLSAAVVPPGSAFSAPGAGRGSGRPRATLLLPPRGQTFVVAELAVGPGESAGAVPSQAGPVSSGADRPLVQVAARGRLTTVQVPSGPSSEGAVPATVTVVACVPLGSRPSLVVTDKGLVQQLSLTTGQLGTGPGALSRPGADEPLQVTGRLGTTAVHVRDASLVWFAGSDGGTVPPRYDEAYLQLLATTTPAAASLGLSAAEFTLHLAGGQVVAAESLPVYDRRDVVVGFLVPSSFSTGTVVVASGPSSFHLRVHFD